MADLPSKAELGAALARVLGSGGVTLAPAASPEERKAAQGELEFRASMRLTRPESKGEDADHERRMVEHSITALRARADQAETEATEASLADATHRENDLRAEATRLRAMADRHEATLRVQDRAKGKP